MNVPVGRGVITAEVTDKDEETVPASQGLTLFLILFVTKCLIDSMTVIPVFLGGNAVSEPQCCIFLGGINQRTFFSLCL